MVPANMSKVLIKNTGRFPILTLMTLHTTVANASARTRAEPNALAKACTERSSSTAIATKSAETRGP